MATGRASLDSAGFRSSLCAESHSPTSPYGFQSFFASFGYIASAVCLYQSASASLPRPFSAMARYATVVARVYLESSPAPRWSHLLLMSLIYQLGVCAESAE